MKYDCVVCQETHKEGEALYTKHIYSQSKKGLYSCEKIDAVAEYIVRDIRGLHESEIVKLSDVNGHSFQVAKLTLVEIVKELLK